MTTVKVTGMDEVRIEAITKFITNLNLAAQSYSIAIVNPSHVN